MAQTQIKLISPFDPRLKKTQIVPEQVPSPLVKAIIHGLLSHLWSDKRRRTKEMGIDQAKLEKMLFSSIIVGNNNPSLISEERLFQIFESIVPQIFRSLTGHSSFLLVGQSDLIMKGLAPYAKLATYEKRVQWLTAEVPGFLGALKGWRPCSECRGKGNTGIPDNEILRTWATTSNVGELRNNVIGHYHKLSPATVKRILSSDSL
jgi:hypothetical protein